jgi:hypothetical protein
MLCGRFGVAVPSDWRTYANVQEAYRQAMREAVTRMPHYPKGKYSGRGVVILGGGKYFASAYVTVRILRHVGCKLPIEVWYLGKKGEMPEQEAAILRELQVTCIDADAFPSRPMLRVLDGWQLKSFAVLHSGFEEILYLDADSYPCRDPQFLFYDAGYCQYGALFFPDAPRMKLLPEVYKILGIPFQFERTIESGQFVVNKAASWHPLALAYWMNQRSDYYYFIGPRTSAHEGELYGNGIHGDKDTFHLAWRYLNLPYAMPAKDYTWISPAVVQHASDGQPVFIHRARKKFHLGDTEFSTTRQDGFEHQPKLPLEAQAHAFLDELRERMGVDQNAAGGT